MARKVVGWLSNTYVDSDKIADHLGIRSKSDRIKMKKLGKQIREKEFAAYLAGRSAK